MGRLGFVGLVLILVALLIGVWMMTGPRAAYWMGVFGTSRYEQLMGNPDVQTRIRVQQGRSERFTASIEDRIEADRSQVYLVLTAYGANSAAALGAIKIKREMVRETLTKAGHEDIIFNDNEIKVSRKRPPRLRNSDPAPELQSFARAKLVVSFNEAVDFVDLFSQPEFADLIEIEKSFYWIADRDKALAKLEAQAAKQVRAKARKAFGTQTYRETGVRFKNSLRNFNTKYTSPILRVVVTATLTVRVEQSQDTGWVQGGAQPVTIDLNGGPTAVEVNPGTSLGQDILDGHLQQRRGSASEAN